MEPKNRLTVNTVALPAIPAKPVPAKAGSGFGLIMRNISKIRNIKDWIPASAGMTMGVLVVLGWKWNNFGNIHAFAGITRKMQRL
jgi:hypothetical protein